MKINDKQSVKLRSDSIKFKNYFKQLAVPFKSYADFESVLKRIYTDDRGNNPFYTKIISGIYSLQFCLQSCMYWW